MSIRIESTQDESLAVTLPLSMRLSQHSRSYAPALQQVQGGRAIRTRGGGVKPSQLSLDGELFDNDPATHQADLDALAKVLHEPEVRVFPDDAAGRHYLAVPTSNNLTQVFLGQETQVQLALTVPDPGAQGASVTKSGSNSSGLGFSFGFTVDGNVPAWPVVTITCRSGADWQDVTITDDTGNAILEITGSYVNGDVLVFDARRYRATLNGSSIADRLSGATVLGAFALAAGDRTLTVSAGGNVLDVQIDVDYRPRWC